MRINFIQKFLQLESSSGIVLFIMALIAMIWANSPLAFIHQRFIDAFLFWINEGLMTFFFLVVGLELKRGFLSGQLSRVSQVALPVVAALGGMIIPALLYLSINYHDPITIKAWATPVATDIAFALGVLSLFGKRVPAPLKLFLLALAIFDDLGAILIIAFFYSKGFAWLWLMQATLLMLVLYGFNKFSVRTISPYLIIGLLLWFTLLRAGVHPTIAGVLLALSIPDGKEGHGSPLLRLEAYLHPLVAFAVIPLFALANAGFSFEGLTFSTLTNKVVLGIMLGLFIGKQLGVFGFSWLLIRAKMAVLPPKSSWGQLYGVALLCGIGFTMSLFLGTLSFESEAKYLAEVRLGVITGSILSGVCGALVMFFSLVNKERATNA